MLQTLCDVSAPSFEIMWVKTQTKIQIFSASIHILKVGKFRCLIRLFNRSDETRSSLCRSQILSVFS